MRVIEFKNENYIQEAFLNSNWSAGEFLYTLIKEDKRKILGWNHIYALVVNQEVVSFCTLSQKDCIEDDKLVPWIGFVFTKESYRGHRYSKLVIDFALDQAKGLGYRKVYLATDHIGLYEKYGFKYLESRMDIYNEESRIYYYDL